MRIGIGYDAHRLAAGRKLVLGGVNIPFNLGLLGHSDADVLCHAIADALLGAAALGDIGKHFPDNDARYKGISSVLLLQWVTELLGQHNFSIINIDSIIIAEQPKLAPFLPQMQQTLAETMGLQPEAVGVKATTTEGMGFCGAGEGIAAQAVALLEVFSA